MKRILIIAVLCLTISGIKASFVHVTNSTNRNLFVGIAQGDSVKVGDFLNSGVEGDLALPSMELFGERRKLFVVDEADMANAIRNKSVANQAAYISQALAAPQIGNFPLVESIGRTSGNYGKPVTISGTGPGNYMVRFR